MIIFHDGFRFTKWKKFFRENQFKNVILDTHIYIFAMEMFVPIHKPWVYRIYVNHNARKIKKVSQYVPVVVGEWCISNRFGTNAPESEKPKRFQEVTKIQLDAWNQSAGSVYWNYQLWRERDLVMDDPWKESWDFCRDVERGYINMDDFLS